MQQSPIAAGGEVKGVDGLADVSVLRLGSVSVSDLTVHVGDAYPRPGAPDILGILGLDVLERRYISPGNEDLLNVLIAFVIRSAAGRSNGCANRF